MIKIEIEIIKGEMGKKRKRKFCVIKITTKRYLRYINTYKKSKILDWKYDKINKKKYFKIKTKWNEIE